jgi:hypothetical protein
MAGKAHLTKSHAERPWIFNSTVVVGSGSHESATVAVAVVIAVAVVGAVTVSVFASLVSPMNTVAVAVVIAVAVVVEAVIVSVFASSRGDDRSVDKVDKVHTASYSDNLLGTALTVHVLAFFVSGSFGLSCAICP